MTNITLKESLKLAEESINKAIENKFKPISVVVLDNRGSMRVCLNQDGTTINRHKIAHGKANAALLWGTGTRAIAERAEKQSYFINSVSTLMNGDFIPVAGGIIIKDLNGNILGSVGISGDISDNDEIAGLAGISSIGKIADTGNKN